MIIPTSQIMLKKRVGKLKGKAIWHVRTRGGLHLIADDSGKPVAAGPHVAVARHLAEQYEPALEWTELSKSDHVAYEAYQHLLPEYRELSDQLRKASNG